MDIFDLHNKYANYSLFQIVDKESIGQENV